MIRNSLILLFICAGVLSASPVRTSAQEIKGFSRMFSFGIDGGYLGVQAAEITKENAGRFGLSEVRGVAVEQVADGSPAKAAGLQAGDVIAAFDGEEVTSVRKLTRLVAEVAPDHKAKLTVLRNGEPRDVAVTLGRRSAPKIGDSGFTPGVSSGNGRFQLPSMPQARPLDALPPTGRGDGFFAFGRSSERQIGIGVTPLTKQLADYFGVTGGVLINDVRENSPAAKAGLRAGDVVIEADGRPLGGDRDLIRVIGEKKTGEAVELTVTRDRSRLTVRVIPEEIKDGFRKIQTPGTFVEPKTPSGSALPAPIDLS